MRIDNLYPDFSWSHSRDRALAECARAYYWRYYGSHRGWDLDAPEQARRAYGLKQLTTFPMILGTAVHECARECAAATRAGKPRPSFEVMLARVSDALNRAVIGSHRRGSFQRDPKRVVMLRDAWYGGRSDSSALAAAVTKARVCLRALEGATVWQDLAACEPEWIIVPDGPEAFILEGSPIYAGLDLVYRPDGRQVVILDWKTGDDSDAELQIPLYALYCRTVLGMPFREGEWFGRVINLATGDDSGHEITRLELMQAVERVRDSSAAMRTMLADSDRNQPRPIEEFPLVEPARRRSCQYCPFLELCEGELGRCGD